jgi:hypothetical protein
MTRKPKDNAEEWEEWAIPPFEPVVETFGYQIDEFTRLRPHAVVYRIAWDVGGRMARTRVAEFEDVEEGRRFVQTKGFPLAIVPRKP